MFDELAREIHLTAIEKGFWDHASVKFPSDERAFYAVPNPSIDSEKLALMHSEISEALDALRDGDLSMVEEELADVIIRVLDFAEAHAFSMDVAVRKKMNKNRERPHLHGRQF